MGASVPVFKLSEVTRQGGRSEPLVSVQLEDAAGGDADILRDGRVDWVQDAKGKGEPGQSGGG